MIMNAVCLLNVLSGLAVNLFHSDSGYGPVVAPLSAAAQTDVSPGSLAPGHSVLGSLLQ